VKKSRGENCDKKAPPMPVPRLIAPTPEDCGVDSAKLELVFQRAEQEVSSGRLQACQVAVCRNGRLAGMRSFGVRPDGGAVADSDLFTIFSATKTSVGVVMWQLIEDGRIELSDPVAKYIPEFATHGKERVLIIHLLNFTAGFPNPPPGGGSQVDQFDTSAGRTATFAKWPLEWEPGSEWQYHPGSAHWVMAEIIERLTAINWRDYMRSRLLDPCGLTSYLLGPPAEHQGDYQFVDLCSRSAPGVFGPAVQSSWNTTEIRALGMPAGGGCTSAADLALLYQPLLNRGQVYGGGQILHPETIARATTQTTDSRHFAYLFAPPAENPDRVPTDTDIRVPKLRGWVVELMGNDALTLTFEEEDDSNTSVVNGLNLEAAFGEGAEVPAGIFRQCRPGFGNAPGSIGHAGMHGQMYASNATNASNARNAAVHVEPNLSRAPLSFLICCVAARAHVRWIAEAGGIQKQASPLRLCTTSRAGAALS
jgi:CubicO group peptidase (beta-lactamase class C family)